ncbi:hypothetical protein LTR53_018898, partial [Teratosphaeriaceae sp. CCFEE 6253]
MATSMPAPPHYSPHSLVQQTPTTVHSRPQSPTPPRPAPAFPHPPRPQSPPPPPAMTKTATITALDGTMDADPTCDLPNPHPSTKNPSKPPSSSVPTPKPARPTPPPPQAAPKGTISGLLSGGGTLFGGSGPDEPERQGVDIDLHIPLNPAGGNT